MYEAVIHAHALVSLFSWFFEFDER